MSDRPDITSRLSKLVEKRLNSRNMYWSPEVNFDWNMKGERRIDFVGFKPFTPDYVIEPTSVELGTFAFYEVKSYMADFESGHGLTFYGDENYLVCTPELAIELRNQMKLPNGIDAVLCPDKNWSKLITKFQLNTIDSHRRRSASEILWAIVQSHS